MSKKFNSKDPCHKYEMIAKYAGIREIAVKEFVESNNLDAIKLMMDVGQNVGSVRSDLLVSIVGLPGNEFQQQIINKYKTTQK